MNYCVNHPDAVVTAYCQNCGKGLCSACARNVQGNIYCEPCMTARTAGAAAPGPGAVPPGYIPPVPPPPSGGPNPGIATLLGFIPGVGAMYNGQYIKAIVHVLVFVILVGMAGRFWFFGLLIAFWVLYQVFDAHQTAKARRDGLPLPDPFGLNELGNRIAGHTPAPPVPPGPATPPPPPGAVPGTQPYTEWAEQVRQQAQQWGQYAGQMGENIRARVVADATQAGWAAPPPPPPGWAAPPPSGWAAPPPPPPGWQAGPVPPVPPPVELERARREPIGAIVLILLGMLFLFNTLGFFSFGWVHHGWPLIIIGIAIWLLARNTSLGGRMHFRHAPPPPPDAQNQTGGGQ